MHTHNESTQSERLRERCTGMRFSCIAFDQQSCGGPFRPCITPVLCTVCVYGSKYSCCLWVWIVFVWALVWFYWNAVCAAAHCMHCHCRRTHKHTLLLPIDLTHSVSFVCLVMWFLQTSTLFLSLFSSLSPTSSEFYCVTAFATCWQIVFHIHSCAVLFR